MIGTRIGSYEITDTLASGGMGDVYRGRHVELPREVVVKTIRLGSFSANLYDQLKKRFLREAFVQSQLDHPNIVRVYEFVSTPENYYMVMEYVDGCSLDKLIRKQKRLDPWLAAALIKQALEALDYAHNFDYVDETGVARRGVIHRDIKPANMLLNRAGDTLKLADFGIVKMVGEHGLTQHGFNPGTPEYMSPEQRLGYELDGRSDLYSIGASLYEMLSDRLPFTRPDGDRARSSGHLRPTAQPLTDHLPQLDPGLDAAVMRALRHDPAERFQTAREFAAALAACEPAAQRQPAGGGRFTDRTLVSETARERASPPTEPDEEATRFGARLTSRLASLIHLPTADRREIGYIVAAICCILLAGGALYRAMRTPPETMPASPAPVSAPTLPPPVEAVSYFVTLDDEQSSGAEPLPALKTLRLTFRPSSDGYLYVIAPASETNQPMMLIGPKPMPGFGVKTNRAPAASGLSLNLQVESGDNVLTVIFSPRPLTEPSFLTARGGHLLTNSEQRELNNYREQYGDGVIHKSSDRTTVVTVPASRDKDRPLVFEVKLTSQ